MDTDGTGKVTLWQWSRSGVGYINKLQKSMAHWPHELKVCLLLFVESPPQILRSRCRRNKLHIFRNSCVSSFVLLGFATGI